MKKSVSILLTIAMLAVMIPAVSVSAANSGKWTDAGNYDLTWADSIKVSDTTNAVTVGNVNYQITGFSDVKTFDLDSAADLAGLAVLVNTYAKAGAFKNCVFNITADTIDMGGKDWTPIGYTQTFGGQLIGLGSGSQVVIKNMTINSEYNDTTHFTGLVGWMDGGAIKNIKLENASVTSLRFRNGSFAGQANNSVLENLSSDADITVTAGATNNGWDIAAGIAGATYGTLTVKNCVFTGTLKNGSTSGDATGGICGVVEGNGNKLISNCIVISDSINGGAVADNTATGHGGIVGTARGALTISNCYVNAHITSQNERMGGIIGSVWNGATLENCQFDGTLNGVGKAGAMIGYTQATTTVKDSVNTGVVASNGSKFLAVGHKSADTVNVTVTNLYSAYTFTDIAPLAISALDTTSGTWTARDGKYPILTIAKDYENAPEEAELSWFDPANTTDTAVIDSYNDLLGLSFITKACGTNAATFLDTYKLELDRVLGKFVTVNLFAADVVTTLGEKLNGTLDTSNVVKLYAQTSTTVTNNKYNVRIIAEINGKDWTAAGFDFMVSYKDANGNVVASNIAEVTEIDTCYTSLLATTADGTTAVTAPDGHYYVVFVLSGIDATNGNVTISAVANVTGNNATVCGEAGSFTFDANGKPVQ